MIDFRRSNLSVVGYSTPVDARMTLEQLRPHLHTDPAVPGAIPYRTSYFSESWGFCLPHDELTQLEEDEYEVRIDSTLQPGHLTYGEIFLQGELDDEVLVSAHVCHPSLANDNLSGVAVAIFLAKRARRPHAEKAVLPFRLRTRAHRRDRVALPQRGDAARIAHGLVLACAGDAGSPTYKRTRQGDAPVDRAVAHVLAQSGRPYGIRDFSPFGYDERQYNSPGFALPVGVFMRTPYGEYPAYHTSSDDLTIVRPEALADSLSLLTATVDVLEGDVRYRNLHPRCEPQLGKRGLYRQLGGGKPGGDLELALLWVLNLSDGDHSLLDIAERADLSFALVRQAADALAAVELLEPESAGYRG